MQDLEKINEAIENLEISEKARVLYTLLVETLRLDPKSCTFKEVLDTLKHYMTKESEAIKIMADTQRIMDKKLTNKETAVS